MRPYLVVLDEPPGRDVPNLGECAEQVKIKHFLPIGPIESLDEGILVWLPRLDVLDEYAVRGHPLHELMAQQLRAIVDPQDIRQATLRLQPLEEPDKSSRSKGGIDLDGDSFPVEVIDHVEGTKPRALVKRIAHEVRRPDLVGALWDNQRLPGSLRQLALAPARLIEPHGAIDPVNPLVIPGIPKRLATVHALPKSPSRMDFDHLVECLDDFGVTLTPVHRFPVTRRAGQANTGTSPGQW